MATEHDEMRPTDGQFPTGVEGLAAACATEILEVADGGHFELTIFPVLARIGANDVRMLSYNGSVPGPAVKVRQGSQVTVDITNHGDMESTVHWHGLRLDNRYDGTHETQHPVAVGQRFRARIEFPDPGIYWYHPHIRQDYGQEMGLYGSVLVEPDDPDYWPAAHRDVVLTVDDILIHDGHVAPFSRNETSHAAMGRFGDTFLVNGEVRPRLAAKRGEVVRVYLVNTANTRVFRIAVPGARMKLVGGDSGRVEHEEFVDVVVLAPSERAVVDVRFDEPGRLSLEHRTPQRTYELATVQVSAEPAEPSIGKRFDVTRTNADMVAQRNRIEPYLGAEPDKTLRFLAEINLAAAPSVEATDYACPMHPEVRSTTTGTCPRCGMKLIEAQFIETGHVHGHDHGHRTESKTNAGADHQDADSRIEWEDDMVAVNQLTTSANTRWKLVDHLTGAENGDIRWRFHVGEQVKIRLRNEIAGDHPMHHPFHIHGAGRFLILSRDGKVEDNLVWKDTALVRTGEVVDLLLDVTNPGRWMAHCHIAEHHESGMMLSFDVVDRRLPPATSKPSALQSAPDYL